MLVSIMPRRYLLYFKMFAVLFLFITASHTFYRLDYLTKTTPSTATVAPTTICGFEEIPFWQQQLLSRAALPPVAGIRNYTEKKLISIGIASVYREENYLNATLTSLVNESDDEERKDVVVVIYLADTDPEKKEKQLLGLKKNFRAQLDSGFFHIVESGPEIYPPMDFALTKRTFNDPVDRVLWRTKQVVDFAFLFSYVKPLSTYHLVLEDDIISSEQYITAIRDFIRSHGSHRWVALHFSGFLGIGLLFHTSDLNNLIKLLLMFHQDQPVDMLMRSFIGLQVPNNPAVARRIPSIFQHIGIKSTLPNKLQTLTDNTFNVAKRKFKNHNPQADLITTMKIYNDFAPEYAYSSAPGLFWGIGRANDTLDIIFQKPINITGVVVITGILKAKKKMELKDTISDGVLEAGRLLIKVASNNSAICENFTVLSEFRNGDVDVRNDNKNISQLLSPVQCLRIKLGPKQKTWVVIREIEIFR